MAAQLNNNTMRNKRKSKLQATTVKRIESKQRILTRVQVSRMRKAIPPPTM